MLERALEFSLRQRFVVVLGAILLVILGILAATALPKFVDLSSDARAAAMNGVRGAMQSANNMVYGRAAATGQQNMTGPTALTIIRSLPSQRGISR